MAPGPAPERLTTATKIKHHVMHVDVHPSMHKPALSHMERTYQQPTHENACPPEALGLPHSVPTVRIPAAGLSAFALTSQWNACARHVARPLSRETTSRLSMSSPHVFPTCLPHPDAEAPSSAERRAERRASRRPHRACSRQRPVRVLTAAPGASAHDSARVRVLTAAPLDGGVSARRRARHGRRVTRRRVRHSRSSVADAICCGSRDRCAQGVCERSRSTDCHAAPRRK